MQLKGSPKFHWIVESLHTKNVTDTRQFRTFLMRIWSSWIFFLLPLLRCPGALSPFSLSLFFSLSLSLPPSLSLFKAFFAYKLIHPNIKNLTSLKSPSVSMMKMKLTKKGSVPNLTFEITEISRKIVYDIPVQVKCTYQIKFNSAALSGIILQRQLIVISEMQMVQKLVTSSRIEMFIYRSILLKKRTSLVCVFFFYYYCLDSPSCQLEFIQSASSPNHPHLTHYTWNQGIQTLPTSDTNLY